jgi:outer membrane protein assembly factor BamA
LTFWVPDTIFISGTLFISLLLNQEMMNPFLTVGAWINSTLRTQGDDSIKRSLYFYSIILSFFLNALSGLAVFSAPPSDTLLYCSANDDPSVCQFLDQILQKVPQQKRAQQIPSLLDSLGFFHATFDSSTGRYSPGYRAVVIAEQIIKNDKLRADLTPTTNYPRFFDAGEVKRRALFLNKIYAENGFPFASINIDTKHHSCDSLKDSLIVIYKIDSDQISYFSSAVFKTRNKTSTALLSKYINFKQGELFDIRKIESSVTRLKARAFIENASSFAPFLTSDSTVIDTAAFVTIPFDIRDRSGLGFEGVVGFESDQDNKPHLQGKAEFSLLNMFRSGESASFLYQGNDLMQQFDISVSKPLVLNVPLQVGGNFGMEIQTDDYGYLYGSLKILTEFNRLWHSGIGLQYNETSIQTDTIGSGGRFFGANFLLLKEPEIYSKNILSTEVAIEVGSGIAKKDKDYNRSHVDFSIGAHIPFFLSQALYSRLVTSHIITSEKTLLPVELNRVGGHNSIRGYAENEFAFRTVVYGQLELLHYFNTNGSVFILLDGGIGFEDEPKFTHNSYSKLFGYGLGIRIPSRLGLMTLEWARNYQDKKNLGRVHVQFQNDLSRITGKFM